MRQIDEGLARAIAGMVAVGTAEGDERAERAQGALQAIGLMLLNADRDSQAVREILSAPAAGTIKREEDGSLTIRIAEEPPAAEPA